MKRCLLLNPGLVEYGKAWSMQKEIFHARSDGMSIDTLIILQHPPTYTFGRRSRTGYPIFRERGLEEFALFRVDRGGGDTYHGPGQLVAYPILGLKSYTSDFHTYLRMLEEVMIGVLTNFDVNAGRQTGYTGVWVEGRKIGSIGVRIVRGITMHGLALNVNNDLSPFNRIIPCNMKGVEMTSMSERLGATPNISDVAESLVYHFARVFDVKIEVQSEVL